VSLLTIIASCLTFKKRTDLAKIIVNFALKMQNDFQDARELDEYLNPTKHMYIFLSFCEKNPHISRSKLIDQDDDKQKLKQQS